MKTLCSWLLTLIAGLFTGCGLFALYVGARLLLEYFGVSFSS